MTDVPYPPSWQNRFFELSGRLPFHRYLLYLLIGLGVVVAEQALAWVGGGLSMGTFDPYQLNSEIWLPVTLIAGDYFVIEAGRSLDQFRPALRLDDDAYGDLRYEFTQVPRRIGWLITGLSVVLSFWFLSFGRAYQQTGLPAVGVYLVGVVMFSMVFFLFYFMWRAIRRTVSLYGQVEDINIFHLTPLYAFSGLSSRVGIFAVLTGVLSYVTNTVFAESPNLVGFGFFAALNVAVAISAFLYPLRGIHHKLAVAREQAAKENDVRLENAYRELHDRADRRDIAGMADFHHEIQALLEFRREIHAISTWPWAPDTLRAFITAMLLPIVLWAIQQILARSILG